MISGFWMVWCWLRVINGVLGELQILAYMVHRALGLQSHRKGECSKGFLGLGVCS